MPTLHPPRPRLKAGRGSARGIPPCPHCVEGNPRAHQKPARQSCQGRAIDHGPMIPFPFYPVPREPGTETRSDFRFVTIQHGFPRKSDVNFLVNSPVVPFRFVPLGSAPIPRQDKTKWRTRMHSVPASASPTSYANIREILQWLPSNPSPAALRLAPQSALAQGP